MRDASAAGQSVIARGSGYSYGDVALNRDHIVLDLTGMNRILSWSSESGIIDVEPGVTIGRLCRHVGADDWWPPVVPGTQGPTIGGCVAANVHGKNNWRAGPIGEQIEELEFVLADGSATVIGPSMQPDLFRAVVGGFGLLGVITRVRLRMRPSSGLLRVDRFAGSSLEEVMAILERWAPNADYMVGWIDGSAAAGTLGRGLTQIAYELPVAADAPENPSARRPAMQPGNGVAALLPASIRSNLWLVAKPLANRTTLQMFNSLQYFAGSIRTGDTKIVSRRRFDFVHDSLPNWNRAFKGGILQYQTFVPKEQAARVFRTALETSHHTGFAPFLTVIKLHRSDSFLLSEGVDGFSMSMDFAVGGDREHLVSTLRRLTDETILPAGGRFYLAKDYALNSAQARESIGPEALDAFLCLKHDVDPTSLFDSDLYRRLFAT